MIIDFDLMFSRFDHKWHLKVKHFLCCYCHDDWLTVPAKDWELCAYRLLSRFCFDINDFYFSSPDASS